jgi:uncharacterized protein (TIGR02118 family)
MEETMHRRDLLATGPLALAATALASAPARAGPMGFKGVYLVKRRADFTYDAFVDHQLETHVPLVCELPGLRHYSFDFFRPDGEAEQPFDGMATVRFDDRAAHDAALASEAGRRALADLPLFLETDRTVVLLGETGAERSFAA